ncbi:alanine--tRNA ligase-related protein [Escherichia coli]
MVHTIKGYDHLELNGKVTALFVDGKAVIPINAGQEAVVVLDQTPFYAESGGQVGDKGELKGADSSFAVEDTQIRTAIGHIDRSCGSVEVWATLCRLMLIARLVGPVSGKVCRSLQRT